MSRLFRVIKPVAKLLAGDGYVNFLANYGNTGANIASGGGFLNNYITREPQNLRTMYRTSFIIRRVCDSRAEDMTKAGIRIDSEFAPELIKDCQSEMRRLKMWQQLANTIRWSMLFGTSFIMPDVSGQDTATPLDPSRIGKGQLRGFQVFDRWQLVPSWQDGRQLDLGFNNGYPIYYQTISNGMGIPDLKIHHSRLFRIDATPLPWWDRYTENFFSASVVEAILDKVLAFEQGSAAANALIEAARNDVIYSDRLPQVAGENSGLFDRLQEKIKQMMRFRSNQGITFLAADEKLERFSTTLSGVAEIIDRNSQQVAGATEIPLCRLLGISSGGLNGGDNDLLNAYYEDTGRRQENLLREIVETFVQMTFLSMGVEADSKDIGIYFYPLKKLGSTEKADIASKSVDMLVKVHETGTISDKIFLSELRQLTEETGYFSNITDEDVAKADAELPDIKDELMGQTQQTQVKQEDGGQ